MVKTRKDSCDNPARVIVGNLKRKITDDIRSLLETFDLCASLSFANHFALSLLMNIVVTKSAEVVLNQKFRVLYSKQPSAQLRASRLRGWNPFDGNVTTDKCGSIVASCRNSFQLIVNSLIEAGMPATFHTALEATRCIISFSLV